MIRNYSSLASCIPDWTININNTFFIVIDRCGNFLFSNPAFSKAFEFSPETNENVKFSSLNSLPDSATINNIFDTCIAETCTTTDWFLESTSLISNNKILVHWNFNAITIEGNDCIIGIGQKSQNSDFVSLDNHYSFLLNALNKSVIFFICDISGNIELVNDNLCDFTQHKRKSLLDQPFYKIIDEPNPKKYWEDLLSIFRSKPLDINELKIKTENGTIYWTRSLINPIFNKNNSLEYVLFVLYDITKHKNIEQEKIELFNKYQKIAANLPGFIYQFHMKKDGSMSFPFITNGVTKLFGVRPSRLQANATPAFQRIHPDDLELVYESLNQSAKNLTIWNLSFKVLSRKGDVIWIQGVATPEKLDDGSIVWHGFNFDITERKISEEKLSKQNRRLEEIAFIQAHEFRRPVANMLGLFDILNSELKNDPINPNQFELWLRLLKKSVRETDEIIAKIVTKTAENESLKIEFVKE